MTDNADDSSGLPLLATYAVLVIIFSLLGFGAMMMLERVWPGSSTFAFVGVLCAALILPWPLAVRLTEPRKSAG